jgi:hypothetical protein
VLPGHPLARHIDDFLADLANANKPRNTIRAYRGDPGSGHYLLYPGTHQGIVRGSREHGSGNDGCGGNGISENDGSCVG